MTRRTHRNDSTDQGPDAADRLRAARLIATAMIMGQLIFIGAIAVIGGEIENSDIAALKWGALAFGVSMIPAGWIVRSVMLTRAHALEGAPRIQGVMAAIIIGYALLEGAALLNLVAWLVTGQPIPNAAVAGLLMGVQVLMFPQPGHFDPRESY